MVLKFLAAAVLIVARPSSALLLRSQTSPRFLPRHQLRVHLTPEMQEAEAVAVAADAGETAQGALRARRALASQAAAAQYESERRRKVLIAGVSAFAGAGAFAFERLGRGGVSGDAQAIAMLRTAEASSPPLVEALASEKPIVVDFFAEWCTDCKAMAPRVAALEKEFSGRVTFVSLDAGNESPRLITRCFFAVIDTHPTLISAPHLAISLVRLCGRSKR